MIKLFFKIVCISLSISILFACEDEKISENAHPSSTTLDCAENPTNNPNCYVIYDHDLPPIKEIFPSESYGYGDVVEFNWMETIAWFLRSDKHKYGFDMDPYALFSDNGDDAAERGRDVYVSVKESESAVVRVRIDPETKDEFHLYRIKNGMVDKTDYVDAKKACSENNCVDEVHLHEGDYAVYYGDEKKERYLHIISYPLQVEKVIFVQFGDVDAPGCNENEQNGCYTKDKVQYIVDKIFPQAIVSINLIEKQPNEIGLSDPLLVELSEPNPRDYILDKINKTEEYGYNKEWVEYINAPDEDVFMAEQKLITKYNRVKTKKIVLAINQMRINWHFKKQNSGEFKNYKALAQAISKSGDGKSLSMKLKSSCMREEQSIQLSGKPNDDGSFTPVGLPISSLKDGCDYDVYADVIPFIPEEPRGVQVTDLNRDEILCKVGESQKECNERIAKLPIAGGIVWGSHVAGDASLNTLSHEIGHSFGLTDIHIAADDPTYAPNYDHYFSVDESNLMGWQLPTGMRLRYRPVFTAVTLDGSLIPDPVNGWATENQWDCVRSYKKCSTLR